MKQMRKKKQKGGGNYTYEQLKHFNSLSIGKLKSAVNHFVQKSNKVSSLESEQKHTNNYYNNALEDITNLDDNDYTDQTLLLLDPEGHICEDIISYVIINPKNAIFISKDGRNSFTYPVKQTKIKEAITNEYFVFDAFKLYKWIAKNPILPNNRSEISITVIEEIEDIVLPVTQSFILAIKNGKCDQLKSFLQRGVDINFKYEDNMTPLHWAASIGHKECINQLLTAPGVDVNARDEVGVTPLHHAAWGGHVACVERLLAAPGVDVNARDKDGGTPLHWAATNDDPACVARLLAAPGVDVNARDKDGRTPLHYAAFNGREACVARLLAAPGVDVNAKDEDGDSPLHRAARDGHDACVARLLAAPGVDVNTFDKKGNMPLHYASYNGHEGCIKILLVISRIAVNAKGKNGWTPLHCAAFNAHKGCIKILLSAPRIDMNIKDDTGYTPLHLAATNGDEECIRLLLSSPNIIVNIKNDYGSTPLHLAAQYGNKECFRLILSTPGVDVDEKDNMHKSALFYLKKQFNMSFSYQQKKGGDGNIYYDIKLSTDTLNNKKESSGPTQGGAIYTTYKNRKYKIHMGKKGGRYILVGANKQKVYL